MNKIVLFLAVAILLPLGLAAQTVEELKVMKANADIRQLMNMTGAGKLGPQMKDQVAQMVMRAAFEAAGSQELDEASKKVVDAYTGKIIGKYLGDDNINALLDEAVPVYKKYLTAKEVNEILEFYISPTGRKMLETMPSIMKEYMSLVMEKQKGWGKSIKDDTAEMQKELKSIADKKTSKEAK